MRWPVVAAAILATYCSLGDDLGASDLAVGVTYPSVVAKSMWQLAVVCLPVS